MSNARLYFLSAINRFGVQIISFIGNVLIARLLTPDDYGLVAMLSIVNAIAWNFTDSGFSDCLIRKKDADKKDFGTVLTFNLVVGAVMYFLIYITAPLVSNYFQREELISISRVIGFSILIKALTVTEITRLRKELKFKTTAIIDIYSNTAAVSIGYIMAVNGFGYWSLVVQTLILGFSNIILLLVLTKWKPYFCFSWISFNSMRNYSFNLMITYFLSQIGQNLYSVFIGKYQNAASLGFYRQAQRMRDIPIMGLNAVISSTTYPLLAKETNIVKLHQMYVSLFNRFFLIHFFLISLLYGIAYPLIELLFGHNWIVSAPYFQLMLIGSIFLPIDTLNSNIARVQGKASLLRNNMILKVGISISALLLTMKDGVEQILIAQIIASFLSAVINSLTCGRLIGFGFQKQSRITLAHSWRPLLSLIVAFFFTMEIKSPMMYLSIFSLIFCVGYILINEFTRQNEYLEIKNSLLAKFR